ncbi:MAG TPA: SpoIID/LytB domain-containing protein [Candidatus Rubrimentiphilum sp.]|nr:SpoIID/LytB domain-containing protein [Candidatus Rubrimentiphilum sp.]
MKRSLFVNSLAAAAGMSTLRPHGLLARSQDDPAITSQSQALRVLLGKGQLQTVDAQTFIFAGRRYRGTASVLPDTGEVVSTVPVEHYLYSVVSREMPRSWPAAALQAQAIVARTYVLQRSNPNRDYDLVPSEADQVYTGIDAETAATSAAVDTTAAQVLRFGNGFALIAYSSCCGGHTESSADAWGGSPLPYLSGTQCTYCQDSQWYQWTQSIGLDRLSAALGNKLAPAGDVQSISLDEIDQSGRARFWSFSGANGSAQVKASDVRRALGVRVLPSLLVRKVSIDGSAVSIEGGGLGHGVGLCQWGARGLALTGADEKAILAFYFPGTLIAES